MYIQCDKDGNEYMLLEEFVDVKGMDNALTLNQQKITVSDNICLWKSTKNWFICCR